MSSWNELETELDRWHAAGDCATFWWRDDDAVSATPELDRLLALAGEQTVPLALAVIPAALEASLGVALQAATIPVTVLQHGYRHSNHAAAGEKKSEFPADRDRHAVVQELALGRDRLETAFGPSFRPVFVPPWNRFSDMLLPCLSESKFRGLSRFGSKPSRIDNLLQVNCHIDTIDWHSGRRFVGERMFLASIVRHLATRRHDPAQRAVPTGILTHHLVMEDENWRALARLSAKVGKHPGARWLTTDEAFDPAQTSQNRAPGKSQGVNAA